MDKIYLAEFHDRLRIWDMYRTVVHNLYVLDTTLNATNSEATMTTTTPTHKNRIKTAPIIRCDSMNHSQSPISAVV